MGEGPFYLRRIEVANQPDNAAVVSVAGWTRLMIANDTNTPVVLSEIRIREPEILAPRDIVSGPFREAVIRHQEVDLSAPLSLPAQVPAHDAMVLWALVEFSLPEDLGRIVFGRYLGRPVYEGIRARTAELTSQVLEDAKKSIKYVSVQSLAVTSLGMADPIVHHRGDKYLADPKFGFLPRSALSDLLSYCVEHSFELPSRTPRGPFRVEAVLSDGRTLIAEYQTGDDPFWFFKQKSLNV